MDAAPPNAERQRRKQYGRTKWINVKWFTAAMQGDLEIVQQMLEVDQVVLVNFRKQKGRTALHLASSRGHLNVVQYLLKAGVNVNGVATDGTTALHLACDEDASSVAVAVVKELIQAGADIDAVDVRGATSLIRLLSLSTFYRLQQMEIFHLLLAAGCNVNAADAGNHTPLYYACGYDDNEEIFTMLIGAGANLINGEDSRLLHECVVSSTMNKLCILLNHGIDLYLRDQS